MHLKVSDYKLSDLQLTNLAKEFYADVLSLAGDDDEVEIKFQLKENETETETAKQFLSALSSFKKK